MFNLVSTDILRKISLCVCVCVCVNVHKNEIRFKLLLMTIYFLLSSPRNRPTFSPPVLQDKWTERQRLQQECGTTWYLSRYVMPNFWWRDLNENDDFKNLTITMFSITNIRGSETICGSLNSESINIISPDQLFGSINK